MKHFKFSEMQKSKFLFACCRDVRTDGLPAILDGYKTNAVIDRACDGNIAIEKIEANQYELILLDVNLPSSDTEELIYKTLEFNPEAKILVFGDTAQDYARKLLQLGAKGYVSNSSSKEEFEKAIDSVLSDKRYVSAALLEHLTQDMFYDKSSNPFNRLSKREIEILQHLQSGEKTLEISVKLKLEISTIGTYKARLLQKLNCADIMQIKSLARNFRLNIGSK